MKKTLKRGSCPKCGRSGKRTWIVTHWLNGGPFSRYKYHIECPNCHWCGPTKIFLWRAIRAWNRRKERKS